MHEDDSVEHQYWVDFETSFPMTFLQFDNETMAFSIAANSTSGVDVGSYDIVVTVKDEH